jgi:threonine synthase
VRYISTRGSGISFSLSDAIKIGIAPDGGLLVPERLPESIGAAFAGGDTLQEVAARLLEPFFAGDLLAPQLEEICQAAFDFPVPLKDLPRRTSVLELFHGPTAAFKDVGARFLAECLSRVAQVEYRPLTMLVATSGDTGGAVAAAFHGKPGTEVAVLFPKGLVSARQEKQLTTWGGNVRAFAVEGNFDDCQRLVKEAMADPELGRRRRLSSANSINVGRLLPQMTYYAWAALEYRSRTGTDPGFIVPSGNLGNAAAATWTWRMGLPLREIVLATNANRSISAFFEGGAWKVHPTVATLATAMDVGCPSNMERLLHLFGGEGETRLALRACQVTDDEIRRVVTEGQEQWGEVWDPHTATAVAARGRLESGDWILVATAHPAKFETVVEPLISRTLPIPASLREVLERPSHATPLPPRLEELKEALG